jgi:hypothetical protein
MSAETVEGGPSYPAEPTWRLPGSLRQIDGERYEEESGQCSRGTRLGKKQALPFGCGICVHQTVMIRAEAGMRRTLSQRQPDCR